MKLSDFSRYAFGICTTGAMLVGCGGSQPPIGAPGAMPRSSAIATHAAHRTSWMLPEAKSEDLLYVSDTFLGDVFVFSYQKHNQVGDLTGLNAAGLCVDAKSNIFVTNTYPKQVLEYAHGGTQPIRILENAGNAPGACSVDPTTGNLAVSSFKGPDLLLVYKRARGTPKVYTDPDMAYMFFCAYDDKGNLFLDGQHQGK